MEKEFMGRTFDDFLFRPRCGVLDSRAQADLSGRLTLRHSIALPIISANMDSVTGAAMAKTMALEGGVGVLHRGMSIADQAAEVALVKRSHGHLVERPVCLPRGATIREARLFIKKHDITGILIEQTAGSYRLAGLLSNRDLPWTEAQEDHKVEEFMTPADQLVTAAPGIGNLEAERILFENRIEKLPLVSPQMEILGLITKKDLILSRQRPHTSKDGKGRLLAGAAIGARGDYLERASELLKGGADFLVMDIAHGHSENMRAAVENFRKIHGGAELICGNVGTAEGALFLKDLGVDGIKVGIGPGRGCRTRLETGAGVPQLQAIREVWHAVGESVPIIADGGVRNDKDIFMAIACGASTVMLGNMLSGTDEAPGHLIIDPSTGQKKKLYRGMTSPEAVLQALYQDEETESGEGALSVPPEGQEMQIPYKGSVIDVLHRVRGHLASSVSYAGERTLADARTRISGEPMRYLIPLSASAHRESYER